MSLLLGKNPFFSNLTDDHLVSTLPPDSLIHVWATVSLHGRKTALEAVSNAHNGAAVSAVGSPLIQKVW